MPNSPSRQRLTGALVTPLPSRGMPSQSDLAARVSARFPELPPVPVCGDACGCTAGRVEDLPVWEPTGAELDELESALATLDPMGVS